MKKGYSLLFAAFFITDPAFAQQIKLSNDVEQAITVVDTAQFKAGIHKVYKVVIL